MVNWYVCFHYFGQGWEDLSRICMYACAQVWALFRVASQSGKQSGHNQVVAATTTTTKSYYQRPSMLSGGNFYHSCFFLVHIRLSWPDDLKIQMMRFKLLKAQCFEVYQNQPHHCQEEDEMARAGMLAIWLTRKRANDHHKAWRISKTLYHSSWPYGLSSLLTDYIKSKHLNQRQKKPQQQSLVWFVLYMQPKVLGNELTLNRNLNQFWATTLVLISWCQLVGSKNKPGKYVQL